MVKMWESVTDLCKCVSIRGAMSVLDFLCIPEQGHGRIYQRPQSDQVDRVLGSVVAVRPKDLANVSAHVENVFSFLICRSFCLADTCF